MKSLLSADFARLKRDKFIYLSVTAMLIYTVYKAVSFYRPEPIEDFDPILHHWSLYYFDAVSVFPLICAIFISLYVCKDFDHKTVRNKTIAGHSKAAVYLSYLGMSFAGSVLIYIAMLIGGLVNMPLYGTPEPREYNVEVYIIIGFFTALSIASAYTFISMLSGSRVKALIASVIVFFAALLILNLVCIPIGEPQFLDEGYMILDGVKVELPKENPNPKYVDGALRTLLECIAEFFPSGNAVLLLNRMVVNPIREIALSLIFTLVTTLGGIFAFGKKDMR